MPRTYLVNHRERSDCTSLYRINSANRRRYLCRSSNTSYHQYRATSCQSLPDFDLLAVHNTGTSSSLHTSTLPPTSWSAFTSILFVSRLTFLFCIINHGCRSRKLDLTATGGTSENPPTWIYDYWKQHLDLFSAHISCRSFAGGP